MLATSRLQLNTSILTRRLLNPDYLPILEDLIDKNLEALKQLQKNKLKRKLDFGPKLEPHQLNETFQQVSAEVNQFLDVDFEDRPSCSYFTLEDKMLASELLSMQETGAYLKIPEFFKKRFTPRDMYFVELQKVLLAEHNRSDMVPIMAHEYTHYVQNRVDWNFQYGEYTVFKEGHARGVQRHIARSYSERENNNAFQFATAAMCATELKQAYSWMTHELGREPHPFKWGFNFESILLAVIDNSDNEHMIGNALFSIYEAKFGPGIYKDVIHETFKFPE